MSSTPTLRSSTWTPTGEAAASTSRLPRTTTPRDTSGPGPPQGSGCTPPGHVRSGCSASSSRVGPGCRLHPCSPGGPAGGLTAVSLGWLPSGKRFGCSFPARPGISLAPRTPRGEAIRCFPIASNAHGRGERRRGQKLSVVIVSKLTPKAQTTIPQPIRVARGLRPGDERSYEIVDGRVMLTKVQRRDHAGRPVPYLRGVALGSGNHGLCGPLERGDVVEVPFPYTDRATRQSRPAVAVWTAQRQDLHGLLWVVIYVSPFGFAGGI